jgi:N-acetylneuraminic acid mutarotase
MMQMEKTSNNGYRFLSRVAMALSMILLLASCEKSTGDDDDLLGNWKRSSEFEGVGRTEAASFVIDNKVYVGGGYDGTDRLDDFWAFDQNTGTWLQRAPFPGTARNAAVAFAVNGKGYVGTGYDGTNRLKDFWQYDPVANIWTRIADFGGTARYGAVAFAIGNKGYVCSGYDGNHLKDLWEYDPAANTWAQKASLTGSKRTDAVAFVYNGKGYVLTGVNSGSYLNDFWSYDPATNAWTEKRKITDVSDEEYDDDYGSEIPRANAAIFVLNNQAYLTNGSRGGILSTAWQYNINEDLWYQKTSFEGASREGLVGFSLNNRGYVCTGNNGSSRFDDLWEFLPDAEQDDNDN